VLEVESKPSEISPEEMDQIVLTLYHQLGNILYVLNQDGFVIFISGAKDKGKTNIALLLAQICWTLNFRRHIATNIWTESYMVEKQITNYRDLDAWLKTGGRKLYILDELGTHLRKMRFQSEQNLLIMDTIQLIRHYDAGFIGIAPSDTFIDQTYLNTDILDARLYKESRSRTKIRIMREDEPYTISHTPATSILYRSKDTANFTLRPVIPNDSLELCCRVAKVYAETKSYDAVVKEFNFKSRKQVGEQLRKHIRHTLE
jgi:hypothetical protein